MYVLALPLPAWMDAVFPLVEMVVPYIEQQQEQSVTQQ